MFKLYVMKIVFLLAFTALFINLSYGQSVTKPERMVQLETEYGTIKIRLYDETPLHRDNFIKLTEEGFYTDLLFHRVIQGFMIQGGGSPFEKCRTG